MRNCIDWIKISTKIFSNRKIKFILSQKKGDKFFKIWIQLLTLAGTVNDRGSIYLSTNVAYTPDTLAVEIGEQTKIVEDALKIFETLEMIRVSADSIIIESWEEHQNVEGMDRVREQARLRMQKSRQRKKEASEDDVTLRDGCVTVTRQNKNKNKNIDNTVVVANNISIMSDENCNSNCFSSFERNVAPLTPLVAEELKALIDEYGEPAVLKGIRKMALANVTRINWLRKAVHGIANGDDFDEKEKQKQERETKNNPFNAFSEKLKEFENGRLSN